MPCKLAVPLAGITRLETSTSWTSSNAPFPHRTSPTSPVRSVHFPSLPRQANNPINPFYCYLDHLLLLAHLVFPRRRWRRVLLPKVAEQDSKNDEEGADKDEEEIFVEEMLHVCDELGGHVEESTSVGRLNLGYLVEVGGIGVV